VGWKDLKGRKMVDIRIFAIIYMLPLVCIMGKDGNFLLGRGKFLLHTQTKHIHKFFILLFLLLILRDLKQKQPLT
jgi:hypothetical protein